MASKKPNHSPKNKPRVEQAVHQLLQALGYAIEGELAQTPKRVAALWLDHLLVGEQLSAAKALGKGQLHDGSGPIVIKDIGVHLVCPHHLTIALGQAHVAYEPNGRIVGFGKISDLVRACTQKLVLQEACGQAIAQALVEILGATGAVVHMQATHPCHNVLHPRSHQSTIITWSQAGSDASCARLQSLLHRIH